MSPTWRREDQRALIEARRIQRELVEATGTLKAVADRLLTLVAELNDDEAEPEDDPDDR